MHNTDSRETGARASADVAQPHVREHFLAFDGLRACAAGMVVAYHLSLAVASYHVFLLGPLISEMKAGVTIFFVISGFLLYLPYARALAGEASWPSWRNYARRRVVRIVPAYWFALTLVAIGPVANDVLSANWWRYYSFTQIYAPAHMLGGLSVAWTLCVEVTFYAVLPVFALAVARLIRGRRGPAATLQLLIIGTLAILSLGIRGWAAHSLFNPVSPHGGIRLVLATSLPGLFDWFAIGLGLAVVVSEWEAGRPRFRAISAMVRHPGQCWLLAGVVFFASVVASPLDLFLAEVGLVAHLLLGVAALLFVLPALRRYAATKRALPVRLLTSKHAVWLGTISYGIYLWHVWLLTAIASPLASAALHPKGALEIAGIVLAALVGTIALGAASWYLVERPAQRRFNRFGRRRGIGPGIGVWPAQRSSVS